MNNFRKILLNKSGSTIILITLLIMASILTVALSLGSIVTNGLKASRSQANATNAYFAAEAGAERVLWEIRKGTFEPETVCSSNQYIFNDFTGCNSTILPSTTFILGNGSSFYIHYATSTATTTLKSFGEYKGTRRAVELKY